MTVHRKRFGATGETVDHIPPTYYASATYEIHDLMLGVDDANYVVGSGSATVESTSTTTTAAAGPSESSSTLLAVTSSTGFVVGRTYEIVDLTTGIAELVDVVATPSATGVTLRSPLTRNYASGSTLRGVRMSASIPDAALAVRSRVDYDEPLRVVWQYGTTSVQAQIRVVRHEDGDIDFAAIEGDIVSLFPDVRTRTLHNERDTLPDVIAVCYRQVRAQMQRDGADMTRLLAGDTLQDAVTWWTLVHLASQGNHPGESEVFDSWIRQCREQRDANLAALRTALLGRDTLQVARGTEVATATTDGEYRRIIRRQ